MRARNWGATRANSTLADLVGRLQTDADCVRVVDGMASSDTTSRDSAKALAGVVKRLAPRWFVMRNAHAGAVPFLLQPRWAMSLLRGPMTRVELDAARRFAASGEPPPWSRRTPSNGVKDGHP